VSARGEGPRQRLFVACELPFPVRDAVSAWQRSELAPREDLRLVRSVHLTLAFLGDVAVELVPALERVLASVPWGGARARVMGPLFLPAHGRRRVVALELEDADGALTAVQAEVAGSLAAEGLYTPEKRPWLPHVTVARFRRPGHPFSLQNVTIPEFGVVRVVLYSSHLEQAGAVHTPLAVFPAS
jgi:2'-5' RNA ligase